MGKISKVWQHFDKLNKLTAKCKICSKVCLTAGNTSNLHSHLKTMHNVSKTTNIIVNESCNFVDIDDPSSISSSPTGEDCEISISSTASTMIQSSDNEHSSSHRSQSQTSQPSIKHCFDYITSMKGNGSKNKEITEALLYFICKDNMPFSMVDGDGFKGFIKAACPLYVIPARNTIRNKLDQKYEYLSNKFKNKMSNKNNLCLTTDIWSDIQMKSYLGITIHFLENNQFFSGTLGVEELTEMHNSQYISEVFCNVLSKWEINQNQVIAIITDNGANIKKAACDTFGTAKYIPCFAHTINLIVSNSIDKCAGLNDIIVRIRNIIKYIKNSVNLSDELRKLQKNQGLPEGKILKLILDVKTRWNSLFYMLQRFLYIFRIISTIILDKPTAPDFVTTNELNIIREIISLLQPFEDLTVKVSGDKYTVISTILPLVNCVTKAINISEPVTPIGIDLKKYILFELNKRFKDLEIFFNFPISTLLDPRFKNLHFQDATRCQKAIDIIKKALILKENSQDNNMNNPPILVPDVPPASKSFDLWSYHESVANIQINQRKSPMYQELYDYLAKPVVDIKMDPLYAWDIMKSMYPNLHSIAKEKLGIISTSVPSERLFSKTGNILSQSRNRITSKRLSKLVFLGSLSKQDWFEV